MKSDNEVILCPVCKDESGLFIYYTENCEFFIECQVASCCATRCISLKGYNWFVRRGRCEQENVTKD